MDERQKKFSLAETVFVAMIVMMFDLTALAIDLIFPGAGGGVQWFGWLLATGYFFLRGARATQSLSKRFLLPMAIQILPDFLLPFQLTVCFLVTVFLENNPEKLGALGKVQGLASGDLGKAVAAAK